MFYFIHLYGLRTHPCNSFASFEPRFCIRGFSWSSHKGNPLLRFEQARSNSHSNKSSIFSLRSVADFRPSNRRSVQDIKKNCGSTYLEDSSTSGGAKNKPESVLQCKSSIRLVLFNVRAQQAAPVRTLETFRVDWSCLSETLVQDPPPYSLFVAGMQSLSLISSWACLVIRLRTRVSRIWLRSPWLWCHPCLISASVLSAWGAYVCQPTPYTTIQFKRWFVDTVFV